MIMWNELGISGGTAIVIFLYTVLFDAYGVAASDIDFFHMGKIS